MALCAARRGAGEREDGNVNKVVVAALLVAGLVVVVGCKKKEEAAAGGIGVADCDEYITRYSACIEKMPAASKPTVEQGFKIQVDAWKAQAATPDGKKMLAVGCKATLATLASNPLCK
jgi:co-chaperonin GroES (HSP10)